MKPSFLLNLTFSSVFCLSNVLSSVLPLKAEPSIFNEQEIQPENVIAIARPLHEGYDLLVLIQMPNKPQCWKEENSNPVEIDALMLSMEDFTGNCERSTDSNGYSIRIDAQDMGLDYLLKIVERDGDLWLIALPRSKKFQELIIGRTYGVSDGLIKIVLNPEWKMTKRTYQGASLNHIYFSTSKTIATDKRKRR